MVFRDDRRAQSTLIGFVLLFGILVVAFSSYQAVVVPGQNAQVEYNHNSNVQTDLQELRNSVLDVRSVERIDDGQYAIVSEHRPTSVQLGTPYPSRLIALNPPPASGTLRTVEPATDVQIENANVTDTAARNLDGNLSALFAAHGTRFLTYEPSYNEYQTTPTTVLEHSLLYNDFSEANVTVQDQTVLNTSGNRITIVLFDGDISRSSAEAVTLDPQTLDGPTAPVPIEPQTGENITLRLPTSSLDTWEQAVGDLSGAQINDAESSENEVVIELQGDQYELRMARVGFDGGTVGEKQFTPIQYEADGATGAGINGTLPGPRVYNATGPTDGTVEQGKEFELTANVSNLGNTTDERAGTPINATEWYLEGSDPGNGAGNSMETTSGTYLQDIEIRVRDTVTTSELNVGNNTLIIRGQDSRGIWGDDTASVPVEVLFDGFYPDSYAVNAGTLTSFENMQDEDGTPAEMRGDTSNAFNIDVTTEQVPAGTYDLELGITTVDLQGSSGGIDVIVERADGTQLGTTTLNDGDSGSVVVVPVSAIGSQQDLIVRYQADQQNDGLDIDFQRFVEST
jgi:hypothetical protein